jgi:enoyl-CoA hydratase/carnithine racemase
MTSLAVRYEVADAIATITLNRPSAHNAINPAVIEGVRAGLRGAHSYDLVRAIVVRGAGGNAFSAGVDLKFFQDEGLLADAGRGLLFTASMRDLLLELEASELPTVAAIEGFALAGGLELALACDFIICSDESRIGDQHANFALVPGAGASQRLPRRVGTMRALDLLLTGRHLNGVQAAEMGLVLRSVPHVEFDRFVEEFVAQFRHKSRAALAAMKRAVGRGAEMSLRDGLDFERLTAQEYFSVHADAHAGLTEFRAGKR